MKKSANRCSIANFSGERLISKSISKQVNAMNTHLIEFKTGHLRNWWCVLAIVVGLTGVQMNAEATASREAPRVEYDNVKSTELLSVYKQAYAEAGFRLKKQTTRKERGAEVINLEFEFPIPQHPRKKNGVVAFRIDIMHLAKSSNCWCSVTRVDFSVPYEGYATTEEMRIAESAMDPADQKATAYIRRKLGKSLPDITRKPRDETNRGVEPTI